jgi:hypothetical protein
LTWYFASVSTCWWWKKKRKGKRKDEGERGIYAPKVAAWLICRMAVWQLDHDQVKSL